MFPFCFIRRRWSGQVANNLSPTRRVGVPLFVVPLRPCCTPPTASSCRPSVFVREGLLSVPESPWHLPKPSPPRPCILTLTGPVFCCHGQFQTAWRPRFVPEAGDCQNPTAIQNLGIQNTNIKRSSNSKGSRFPECHLSYGKVRRVSLMVTRQIPSIFKWLERRIP